MWESWLAGGCGGSGESGQLSPLTADNNQDNFHQPPFLNTTISEGFYNSKFNSKIANLCFDFIQPHPLSWIFAVFCLKYFMICKNLKSGSNDFDQIKTKWKFMIRGGLSTVQKYRPELLISSHLTESAQDKRISNQRKGKLLKWKQTQQLHEFK